MLPDPERSQGKLEDLERVGDNQTLLTSAYEAIELARRFDSTRLPQALTTYVRLLTRDGQHERAQKYAEEILQIEQHSSNAVEAMIALGVCAGQANQLDKAEHYFHQAADLSRKIGYSLGLARALQNLTNLVLIVRGQFHLAISMMEEAAYLREEQGVKHWSDPFLRGLIYQMLGERRLARQVLDELVLQVEPGTRLAAAYYFLWARLALDEEDVEQAKEYLRLGLRLANRIGMVDLNLRIRLEFSRFHRMRNEAPVARTWAEDGLLQAQRHNALYFCGLALIERAQANWESGDKASAEADLNEAVRTLEPLRASYDLARARYLRALWYRQDNHPEMEAVWIVVVRQIIRDGYAFLLEKEQDSAFPLVAAHLRSKTSEVRAAAEDLMRHLANVPPPPLRIVTLGQFAVWKGRRRIPDQSWTRRKAGELFRYLMLQPNRAAGREVIIEALWPENESDNPSDMLHQSTSALRHALEPDLPDKFPSRYLKVEGEHISLVLPYSSVIDFEQFDRSLPIAIQGHSIDRLQEALQMYSGDLFPSDRYADWSAEKRQCLAELRQRGLIALAQAYLNQQEYYSVITSARQVLSTDAWNEDAVLLIMKAYAGLQDAPHALQIYQNLEKTLHAELEILPRADLRAFAETLRKR